MPSLCEMRIGIDCRLSGPQHAGIGRYIENLMIRLPKLDSQITWVLFVNQALQAEKITHLANVEIHVTPVRHYSLAEQWQMLLAFNQAHLDLLYVPHFNVPVLYHGKLVITIHDLLWHEYRGGQVTTLPSSIYWLKYAAYRFVSTQSIKHATQILVPTHTIAQTLAQYYPETTSKVTVAKEGIDDRFFELTKADTKVLSQLPNNKKILVYIGSLYPHKNLALVIKALKKLSNYHLVICGSRNVFQTATQKMVSENKVQDQVSSLGYVSDGEVAELLRHATALVQPSLSEGFGLTGLEAMAVGTPVLASNIPVFKEVYQDNAIYFDPSDPDSFVAATQLLTPEKRKQLISSGQSLAKTFSWDTMAQKTLDVFKSVLAT